MVLGVQQICNYAPTLVPGNEVSENSTDNPITPQEILISEKIRPRGYNEENEPKATFTQGCVFSLSSCTFVENNM